MPDRQKGFAESATAVERSVKDVVRVAPSLLSVINSSKIFSLMITCGLTVLTAGAFWGAFKSQTESQFVSANQRIEALTIRVEKLSVETEEMKLHGHTDHERRLAVLENKGTDRLIVEVAEHTRQIDTIAKIVANDHDILVRVVTLLEQRDKQNK